MSGETEGIDFRPFLDMAIGILFILLILIGALIFFQRVVDEESRADSESARILWEQEAHGLLRRVADGLKAGGIEATADLTGRRVSVPMASVIRITAGRLAANEQGMQVLARVLDQELACAAAPGSRSGCMPVTLLRIAGLRQTYRLRLLPDLAAGLAPHAYAHLVASVGGAVLLQQQPSLLSIVGSGGGMAVQTAEGEVVQPFLRSADARIDGEIVLGFGFSGEPARAR